MIACTVLSVFIIFIFLKIITALTHRDCRSKVCLARKTALVTGGNSGIGYQIVLALAQRGCKVIIADKYEDKDLLENIFKETRSRNIVFKYVDLASFKSVRELTESVRREEEKLDILINNAGIGRVDSKTTEDGLNIIMQVNYFSGFLLTRLLEDLLKKDGGRIIFTSSGMSYIHTFSLEGLQGKGPASSKYLYNNSKLGLIMISDIFAERLKKYGVTSNSYHPGLVNTNIFKRALFGGPINFHWCFVKWIDCMAFLFGKTSEQGAQTAIHLACANEVEGITGEFFHETKVQGKPKLAYDKNLGQAVWEATEEIVKLKLE